MFGCHKAVHPRIWLLIFLSSVSFLVLLRFPSLRHYGSQPEFQVETPANTLPYTAVILYLVARSRATELLDSLASIHTNLPGPPWPIVLFHTGDFDDERTRTELIARIVNHLGEASASSLFAERIEFVKLDWRLPQGIPANKELLDPIESYRWPGYHHMCAFFATEIFSTPRLRDVTYYMRMDTDSLITEPLCYDPFEVMHVRRRSYGYLSIGEDPPQVVAGMWKLVNNYALAHPLVAAQLRVNKWQWPHENWPHENVGEEGAAMRFKGYDNNFEVVELEAFRRSNVTHWLEELMSVPERIFKWRWGDAPIRFATVQMFFDSEKDTERFCGMRYSHPDNPEGDCACEPLQIGASGNKRH